MGTLVGVSVCALIWHGGSFMRKVCTVNTLQHSHTYPHIRAYPTTYSWFCCVSLVLYSSLSVSSFIVLSLSLSLSRTLSLSKPGTFRGDREGAAAPLACLNCKYANSGKLCTLGLNNESGARAEWLMCVWLVAIICCCQWRTGEKAVLWADCFLPPLRMSDSEFIQKIRSGLGKDLIKAKVFFYFGNIWIVLRLLSLQVAACANLFLCYCLRVFSIYEAPSAFCLCLIPFCTVAIVSLREPVSLTERCIH